MRLDNFDIGRELGSGGMGAVYLVTHRATGASAALKVMSRAAHRKPRYRRMFRREAESLARLAHPNVVRVLDVGVVEAGSTHADRLGVDSPYLIMEHLDGSPPAAFFRDTGAFGWPELRHLLDDVLAALAHAHAVGVIHRDLKPNNLLIQSTDTGRGWTTKLFDFGIARATDELSVRAHTTTRGSVVGTPTFMAPEQVLQNWRDQGPATDLYALGCLAWQASTGAAPFAGSNPTGVLLAHVKQPVPDYEPLFSVPDGFEAWLRRLLAKDPYARLTRAADASAALDRLGQATSGQRVAFSGDSSDHLADTLLDTTRSELLDRPETTQSVDDSAAVDLSIDPAEPHPPGDWREHQRSTLPAEFDVGLGLFGLRRPAPSGREAERDQIWSQLQRTLDTGRPQSVTIRGPAGMGKSRLVRWLERLTHESGIATTLMATHNSFGGPLDGLAPMFVRHFRTRGLTTDEITERLDRRLKGIEMAEDARAFAASTLSRLMASANEGASTNPRTTQAERHAAMASTLAALARHRAVVLWLDDIQWGQRALDFAHHLLSAQADIAASICIVSTIRAAPSDHASNPQLDALLTHGRNVAVELGPLPTEDQASVVDKLVPLDARTRDEVVARTGGNPLFAEQLLVDWVERGVLTRQDMRFTVSDSTDARLPSDLEDLWSRRIETVSQRLPASQREPAHVALELAAALGQDVSRREWNAVIEHAGIEVPEDLLSELSAGGLVSLGIDGWSFEHSLLRDALERRSRGRGRWRRANECGLEMLRELYTEEAPDFFERRARFLHHAGHGRAAVADIIRAFQRARDTDSTGRRRQLLDIAADWQDELALGRDDRLLARLDLCRALRANDDGSLDEALSLSHDVLERAEEHQWVDVRGLARVHIGNYRVYKGQMEPAVDMLTSGIADLESVDQDDSREPLARGLLVLSANLRRLGELDRAEDAARRARSIYRAIGHRPRELRARLALADLLRLAGRTSEAREEIERSRRTTEHLQSRASRAELHHTIGELERDLGHLERALVAYRESARLWSAVSELNGFINELNTALTLLGLGEFDEAEPLLDALEVDARRLGLDVAQPVFDMAAALCHLNRGDVEACRKKLSTLDDASWRSSIAAPDIHWLAGFGVDLAREIGCDDLADRLAIDATGGHPALRE